MRFRSFTCLWKMLILRSLTNCPVGSTQTYRSCARPRCLTRTCRRERSNSAIKLAYSCADLTTECVEFTHGVPRRCLHIPSTTYTQGGLARRRMRIGSSMPALSTGLRGGELRQLLYDRHMLVSPCCACSSAGACVEAVAADIRAVAMRCAHLAPHPPSLVTGFLDLAPD